jgi:1-acyl-sn-glycerol-3-phosphate acyltransferase
MIAALTLLIVYVLLALPAAVVGLPWTLLTRDITLLYRWSMWIVRLGFRLVGIRVEVSGREQVPRDRACVFMSNHVSNLDPPVLLPVIPGRTSAFLKRSLMRIPLLGWGMQLADFIPVDRDGSVEGAKESVSAAMRVLRSGVHVTSFVEGTRSRDGRLLPFKKGPFYLAMETGAPVVAVSIWGTEQMMRKGSVKLYPGAAHVQFHAPLMPADFADRDQLMAAVRAAIASGLPEWMGAVAGEN